MQEESNPLKSTAVDFMLWNLFVLRGVEYSNFAIY